MGKNYYEILGISPEADIKEIKRAYRKKALEVHPDKANNAPGAFYVIDEAYKILSNPDKKREYDKKTHPTEKSPVYKYCFGTDLRTILKVKMSEILSEKTKKIITTRKGFCKTCNGTGSENKLSETCPLCWGSGVNGYSLLKGSTKPCRSCQGRGRIPKGIPCKNCQGTGLEFEIIKETVKLLPRHLFSKCIVITGSGNCCPDGPSGDLLIELDIERDSTINQKGLDFEKILEISPVQAILGDKITIDVYGHKEEIIIPAGTQYGHLLEKEGAGLHLGKEKGNLQLRIRIKVPENITEKQKELYKQLLAMEK